ARFIESRGAARGQRREAPFRFGRRVVTGCAAARACRDQRFARRCLRAERRRTAEWGSAMTDLSEADRVEQRVNSGLLGQWYVVAKSVEIGRDKPHGVKALGRNLVLWRGADGQVRCLDDRCPHRGAPLSRGEIVEGNIACRYHGVTLDS